VIPDYFSPHSSSWTIWTHSGGFGETETYKEMWKERQEEIHQGSKMRGRWDIKKMVRHIKCKAEREIDF